MAEKNRRPAPPPPRSEFLGRGYWVGRGLVGRTSLIVEGWVWVGEYQNVAPLVPGWLVEWGTCWVVMGIGDG